MNSNISSPAAEEYPYLNNGADSDHQVYTHEGVHRGENLLGHFVWFKEPVPPSFVGAESESTEPPERVKRRKELEEGKYLFQDDELEGDIAEDKHTTISAARDHENSEVYCQPDGNGPGRLDEHHKGSCHLDFSQ